MRQNEENERLERKLLASKQQRNVNECEMDNALNENSENWDNWDACYMCAGNGQYQNYQQHSIDDHSRCELPPMSPQWSIQQRSSHNSICYVFMPGQAEPIPVRLRTARIPGGAMWITYRPDVDIPSTQNLYSNSVSQIAQAQRPIVV